MSERREDHRQEAGKLWDKTFEDNQDLDDSGHLSRTVHRKQSSHNSRITTILIVLIVILAATPIIYWVHHEQSFNHPQQTEKVAQATSSKVKKASSHAKSKTKAKSQSKSASAKSQAKISENEAESTSITSTQSSSTSSTAASTSSTSQSGAKYATVESGQGIYRVAANNGLTVAELASLNNISPNTPLHPGQRLRVK
ncbi:LysM domain-containing protein [Limosilactobacillus mucosae]|uniref:SAG1386/EF1546 family surface-associated protein n=1 Tax=Limosilactobacillus mucosae TaxID=97478 RepID=UPI00233EB958|nr:SAG1386/EF1546 family surface-associated protein [Limosilactobacillus mucosae]MDC2840867.1 LysM domain-containing protein [Limosilactobacillus mucosae]MDC2845620.1 LysM domain-containing protein [Limosilactobacillus mucosae]